MDSKIFTVLKYFQNALNDRFIGIEIFSDPEVKAKIIELNTNEQLFKKGIDSKGDSLPFYSEYTEVLTGGLKQAGQPFNLFDTGEFYRSFVVEVLNSGDAKIKANTVKVDPLTDSTVDLKQIASQFIIGLTDESKKILAQLFKEKIQQKIRTDLSRI